MAGMLQRLLRVRTLLEEVGLMHLQQQAQRSAQAEQVLAQEGACAVRLRAEGLAPLLRAVRPDAPGGTSHPDTRSNARLAESGQDAERRYFLEQERAAVIARKKALARAAAEENERLLLCREEFLARRRERQQLEALIEEARSRDYAEQTRREQRMVDDWFAAGRGRQQRSGDR